MFKKFVYFLCLIGMVNQPLVLQAEDEMPPKDDAPLQEVEDVEVESREDDFNEEKEEVPVRMLTRAVTSSEVPLEVTFIQAQESRQLRDFHYVKVFVNGIEQDMLQVSDVVELKDLGLHANDYVRFEDERGNTYGVLVNPNVSDKACVNLYLNEDGNFALKDGKVEFVSPYPYDDRGKAPYSFFVAKKGSTPVEVVDANGNIAADTLKHDPSDFEKKGNLVLQGEEVTKLFADEDYALQDLPCKYGNRFDRSIYQHLLEAVSFDSIENEAEKVFAVGIYPTVDLTVHLSHEGTPLSNVTLQFFEDVEESVPLKSVDGSVFEGVTDENGTVHLTGQLDGESYLLNEDADVFVHRYGIRKHVFVKASNLPNHLRLDKASKTFDLEAVETIGDDTNGKPSVHYPLLEEVELHTEKSQMPEEPITGDETNVIPYTIFLVVVIGVVVKIVYDLKHK